MHKINFPTELQDTDLERVTAGKDGLGGGFVSVPGAATVGWGGGGWGWGGGGWGRGWGWGGPWGGYGGGWGRGFWF